MDETSMENAAAGVENNPQTGSEQRYQLSPRRFADFYGCLDFHWQRNQPGH
jgi:hypothetical protein